MFQRENIEKLFNDVLEETLPSNRIFKSYFEITDKAMKRSYIWPRFGEQLFKDSGKLVDGFKEGNYNAYELICLLKTPVIFAFDENGIFDVLIYNSYGYSWLGTFSQFIKTPEGESKTLLDVESIRDYLDIRAGEEKGFFNKTREQHFVINGVDEYRSKEIEINSEEERIFLEKIINGLDELLKIEQENLKQKAILEIKRKEEVAADLVLKKDSILTEFDKDGNGTIDVIEGADDFLTLFKKYQKAIIEIDKDYIQKFVKTSNYLKTKRRNIQSIFENFQQADTHEDLENRVGILKNDIHTYEVLLMHSLNMIMTLVNEDMITFYEIYESLDKLNVFNSNWENEVSGKLSDIGDGLNQLIYSVNKMNQDIVQELSYLSYTTEASFQELQSSVSAELSSINSSIQFGNLLSGIQTYQLHKINKRGDNLLK